MKDGGNMLTMMAFYIFLIYAVTKLLSFYSFKQEYYMPYVVFYVFLLITAYVLSCN